MKRKFCVVVRGSNVWLALDGSPKLYGFYTHRYVKAGSETEAQALALGLVKKELKAKTSAEATGPFSIEEVRELKSFGDELVPGKGFTFFPQKPDALGG